ncbi:hypothetical protein [Paraliomyxa miuraensis]|uniref:hypothetical protein n=1 Tax=Paraliomyxa miuraensis TaxID=376150 RepID=UPI002250A5EF|nr:hypothetical protein [Paraliomyxa miuraensis]MCX4243529.1 hypothetical protein [Paraliomyxa miuraensis]
MTPLRKKLAITAAVLGGLLMVAVGVVAHLWHQATALPKWYTEGDVEDYAGEISSGEAKPSRWIALDEQGNRFPEDPIEGGAEAVEGRAEPGPVIAFEPAAAPQPRREDSYDEPDPPRLRIPRSGPAPSRHELRGFHRNVKKPSPAVRASRAVYEDGQLEIGVILDLRRLPTNELGPRDRARYERAIENFPSLIERDVWVGVEDQPLSVEGYLALSPGAEVRVGELRYSLDDAAKRLGMTPLQLRLELNRALRRLGFVDPRA